MSSYRRRGFYLALSLATAGGVATTSSGGGQRGVLFHNDSADHADHAGPTAFLKKQVRVASEQVWKTGEALLGVVKAASAQASNLFWGRIDPAPSASASVARWVAGCCETPSRRDRVAGLGRGVLLDWLLSVACDDPSVEQQEAERALVLLLSSDASASSVLSRPGAVPCILRHIALGKASDSLAEALEAYCSVAADSAIMETGMLTSPTKLTTSVSSSASASSSAHRQWLHVQQREREQQDKAGSMLSSRFWFTNAPLADMRSTIHLLQGQHGLLTQHLASSFLASWAEASDANRHKLTGLGIHMAIESLALSAIERPEWVEHAVDQLWELTRIVRAMTRGAPAVAGADGEGGMSGSAHHLACCVEPLLYVAADALARQQDHLAAYAIDTLALMCGPSGGKPVRAAVRDSNMEPLLRKLAAVGGLRPELQRIVVHAVGALAQHGVLPEEMVPHWRDWVLDLLLFSGTDAEEPATGGSDHALAWMRQECVQALHGLASTPGTYGQQVAHYWLAALLRRLAERVAPYNSLRYKDGEVATRNTESLVDIVSVLPSYVREVAGDLRSALDAAAEDPYAAAADFDLIVGGTSRLRARKDDDKQRAAARNVDACLAAKYVCDAFQVLNAMVAPDPEKQRWLVSMGVLPLVQLMLGSTAVVTTSTVMQSTSVVTPTTLHLSGVPLRGGKLEGGLLDNVPSEGGVARGGPGLLRGSIASIQAPAPSLNGGSPQNGVDGDQSPPPCFNSGALQLCLARQAARLLSQLALQPTAQQEISSPMWYAWLQQAAATEEDCWLANYATKALMNLNTAKAAGSTPMPIFRDAIHLLSPSAEHHRTLSTKQHATAGGSRQGSPQPPEIDIVFVHGIKGDPFSTWRKPEIIAVKKKSHALVPLSSVWPSTWVAEDFPTARLLTIEYLAPFSGWEGESLPLEDTASMVMDQLCGAGVGDRPIVFVVHSLGGLLVKEILSRAMSEGSGGSHAKLSDQLRGVVFFATPHFGSQLAAMGWKLRHVPYASPAPSLARLKPGPHLVELNNTLKRLHDTGCVRVISAIEGRASDTVKPLPKMVIVPPESAYPGFGDILMLPDQDHISICKPAGQSAPSYIAVRDTVRAVLAESGKQQPHV